MPVLLAVVMLVVQFALTYHAAQVAQVAAEDAARVAQGATSGGVTAGRAEARRVLADSAPTLFTTVTVAVTADDSRVVAVVSGRVVSLLPGWAPRVTGRAGGPVETFDH
ncbi:MAG: pilus assembly protein [Actinobacteria bacterium]|nr:pilus assembly protein [Actinomycetota bacterium]